MPLFRIDRLLSERGYCTRSVAPSFLGRHAVAVAGNRIRKSDEKVDPDQITIDAEPIDPGRLVILMNKPTGVTCSHTEKGPLVYDLLPERWTRRNPPVATVGRLDKETSGVLLLTDDGQLLHRLTSPKRHVPREYLATLRDPLRGNEAEKFASGTFRLDDDPKPLLPVEMAVITPTQVRLTLHEGRYHQIRRMFAAVGNFVVQLHRDRFGPISADDLPPGHWRHLNIAGWDILAPRP